MCNGEFNECAEGYMILASDAAIGVYVKVSEIMVSAMVASVGEWSWRASGRRWPWWSWAAYLGMDGGSRRRVQIYVVHNL